MINVQEDGIAEAQTVSQTDSSATDTTCFSKNVESVEKTAIACRKESHNIYFKLIKHQSQEIMRSPGIVGSGSGNQLEI